MLSSGFFLKKKPLGTMQETPQELENRRKYGAGAGAGVNKAGLKRTATERIAIVGAGMMGQGPAEVFAAARVWKSVVSDRKTLRFVPHILATEEGRKVGARAEIGNLNRCTELNGGNYGKESFRRS